MKYRNIKIRVNPENSAAVQEALFDDGCEWLSGGKEIQHEDSLYLFVSQNGILVKEDSDGFYFKEHRYTEVAAQSIIDPNYEVKLAWANGETVQFYNDGWVDWNNASNLSTDWFEDWRIKLKSKIIKQWERKYWSGSSVEVATSRNMSALYHGEASNEPWLGEAYEAEYEVPND